MDIKKQSNAPAPAAKAAKASMTIGKNSQGYVFMLIANESLGHLKGTDKKLTKDDKYSDDRKYGSTLEVMSVIPNVRTQQKEYRLKHTRNEVNKIETDFITFIDKDDNGLLTEGDVVNITDAKGQILTKNDYGHPLDSDEIEDYKRPYSFVASKLASFPQER
jgi:hypothetical protein